MSVKQTAFVTKYYICSSLQFSAVRFDPTTPHDTSGHFTTLTNNEHRQACKNGAHGLSTELSHDYPQQTGENLNERSRAVGSTRTTRQCRSTLERAKKSLSPTPVVDPEKSFVHAKTTLSPPDSSVQAKCVCTDDGGSTQLSFNHTSSKYYESH